MTRCNQISLLGQYPEKFKKDGRPLGLYFFGFRGRPKSDIWLRLWT